MNDQLLPGGFVVLRGVAIHVAKLRRYTTDVRRFMRFLPFVEDLENLGVGTPAWKARLRSMKRDEIRGTRLTIDELGRLYFAEAAELGDGLDEEEEA